MKVHFLTITALMGMCYCDKLSSSSSYSLLPYENEISNHPPPQSAYQQALYNDGFIDYADYPTNNDKKKKYTFRRIVRAPLKALKGAGNYMRGMFDDMRTRFLELNGSLLPRSKGDLLKSGSENLRRQTLNVPPPPNLYPAQTYYSPYQPPVQNYEEPAKDYSYQDAEVRTDGKSNADIILTDAEYREIGNSIDDGYKTQDDFGLQSQLFLNKRGVGLARSNDISFNREGAFKNFSPSPRDFSPPISTKNSRDFDVLNNVPLNNPYSLTPPSGSSSAKKREIVQQRSRYPLPDTQRNQRSYINDNSYFDYGRPIPVPVPIAVSPARLVFPSLQNMHPVVGY